MLENGKKTDGQYGKAVPRVSHCLHQAIESRRAYVRALVRAGRLEEAHELSAFWELEDEPETFTRLFVDIPKALEEHK